MDALELDLLSMGSEAAEVGDWVSLKLASVHCRANSKSVRSRKFEPLNGSGCQGLRGKCWEFGFEWIAIDNVIRIDCSYSVCESHKCN